VVLVPVLSPGATAMRGDGIGLSATSRSRRRTSRRPLLRGLSSGALV